MARENSPKAHEPRRRALVRCQANQSEPLTDMPESPQVDESSPAPDVRLNKIIVHFYLFFQEQCYLTFVFFDIVTGKPSGHLAQRSFPPAAIFALCYSDHIALVEAQLVIVLTLEGILRLHDVQVHGRSEIKLNSPIKNN